MKTRAANIVTLVVKAILGVSFLQIAISCSAPDAKEAGLMERPLDREIYKPTRFLTRSPKEDGLSYKSIWLNVGKGEQINAWLVSCLCEKPKGLIVHFHGTGTNISGELRYVTWVPKGGYDLLTFDYRGYGLSSGDHPTQEKTLEDGLVVLRYAASLNYPKMHVLGQSLGAAIAYTTVARAPEIKIDKLLLESGFGSYRRIVNDLLQAKVRLRSLSWFLSFFVTDVYSPNRNMNRPDLPVLLMHGTVDKGIRFKEAELFFEELNNKEKKFIRVAGGDHVRTFLDFGDTYQKMALEFFNE